jgi:hypothetical protein
VRSSPRSQMPLASRCEAGSISTGTRSAADPSSAGSTCSTKKRRTVAKSSQIVLQLCSRSSDPRPCARAHL